MIDFNKLFREYGIVDTIKKGVCKGNCRRCKANRITRGRNHPAWEEMFWDSISSTGSWERSPRWRDRKYLEDITQFEMGLNNRMFKKKYKIT